MALQVHVVYTNIGSFDKSGNLVNKQDPNTSVINTIGFLETKHYVIKDNNVPNSINNPDIKTYIELEAAEDFEVKILTQTMIVSYKYD